MFLCICTHEMLATQGATPSTEKSRRMDTAFFSFPLPGVEIPMALLGSLHKCA